MAYTTLANFAAARSSQQPLGLCTAISAAARSSPAGDFTSRSDVPQSWQVRCI
jgi:hypothetical protein